MLRMGSSGWGPHEFFRQDADHYFTQIADDLGINVLGQNKYQSPCGLFGDVDGDGGMNCFNSNLGHPLWYYLIPSDLDSKLTSLIYCEGIDVTPKHLLVCISARALRRPEAVSHFDAAGIRR